MIFHYLLLPICSVVSQSFRYGPEIPTIGAQERVSVLAPYSPYSNPTVPYFSNGSHAPIIETSLGLVKGKLVATHRGTHMIAYLSVPYSEIPEKFGAPVRKLPWRDVYDASEYAYACSNANEIHVPRGHETHSDDCHYLKLLVPADQSGPLPVLFWLHGGGFSAGSNSEYDLNAHGDNFIKKGVIIVQPNYRIGPLGFWSAETEDAPGNLALWDALEALQFTHREIAAFGGDPHRITIMGQGAGGILASGLTLSPLSQGLYAKSASFSGNMWSPKVHVRPEVVSNQNKLFATACGCDDGHHSLWNAGRKLEMLTCLRSRTTSQLLTAAREVGLDGPYQWYPRIPDGKYGMLPASLEELARDRPPLPVLQGTSKHETAWDLIVSQEIFDERLGINQPLNSLPRNLASLNNPDAVAEECRKRISTDYYRNASLVQSLCTARYIGEQESSRVHTGYHQNQFGILNRKSDRDVRSPSVNEPLYWLHQAIKVGSVLDYQAPAMLDMAHQISQGNCDAYLYSLDYVRAQAGDWWNTVGAFHNMDILLMENFLLERYGNFTFDHQDKVIQKVLLDMLINFAKSGNPTPAGHPEFLPLGVPSDFFYYSISYPTSQMKPCYHQDDVLFWKQAVPLTIGERESDSLSIPWTRHQCENYREPTPKDHSKCRTYKTIPVTKHHNIAIPHPLISQTNYSNPRITGYEHRPTENIHHEKSHKSVPTGYEHEKKVEDKIRTGYEIGQKVDDRIRTGYENTRKNIVHSTPTGYEKSSQHQIVDPAQYKLVATASPVVYRPLPVNKYPNRPVVRSYESSQGYVPARIEHSHHSVIFDRPNQQYQEDVFHQEEYNSGDERPEYQQDPYYLSEQPGHVYKIGLKFGDVVKTNRYASPTNDYLAAYGRGDLGRRSPRRRIPYSKS